MIPKVSIIIVNWNTRDLVDQSIASIIRFEKTAPFEIIVVDNASVDGSIAHLEAKYPHVRVIANSVNLGFAKANNQGAAAALARHLLLFNSDAYLTEEILPACLERMQALGNCILACRILNPDGSLQFSVDSFPSLGGYLGEVFGSIGGILQKKILLQSRVQGTRRMDWATGAFLMVETETYRKLGGLNEGIFMYGEDMEFCHRAAAAGIPCHYFTGVSVVHIGGGSANYDTVRSLILTDLGRLQTFASLKGRGPALALRGILILRSLLRGSLYLAASLLPKRRNLGIKARHHFTGILVLVGLINAKRFI